MTTSIFSVKSHESKCAGIAYDEISNNILTVSVDGTVNVWPALTDTCLKTYSVSGSVNSMVYEKERIFIASSLNIIESYCTNNVENMAVLSQFLSEVNHIRLSKDKSCLVACSSDNSAKVLHLSANEDNELREIILTGHEGPVISTDIDADCTLIATASCDGCISIWRARDGVQITKLPILDKIKAVTEAKNLCRLRFSPGSDPILAVPLADQITLLDCDDWSVRGILKWDRVCNKSITECLFSDDGTYLIAGTLDGQILVWNISNLSLINSWSSGRGSAITGMLWYPKKEKTVLFCDAAGFWEAVKLDLKKKDKETMSIEELEDMFEDFDEDEVADIDDVDLDKESLASTVNIDSNTGDEFNLSRIKAEFEKKDSDVEVPPLPIVQQVVAKKNVHQPVRSGATPVADGMQLLLWNSVGALKKHYDEEGNSESLEAYFHDGIPCRSIIVKPEVIDCDMGDMNTFALLLVSDQDVEEDDDYNEEPATKLACVYVQSVNGEWRTWMTNLPRGESPVVCCLVGKEYAVVLTDKGYLRYFSLAIGGMQAMVESVNGRPVALVGGSTDEERDVTQIIVVVEREGGGLEWRLEEVCSNGKMMWRGRMVGSVTSGWHPLPLSPGESRLSWIGFSDGGSVYTVDSAQCIRRLVMTRTSVGWSEPRWCPVLDLSHIKGDKNFIVGFSDQGTDEGSAGAMVIKCQGSRWPKLVPWPSVSLVPFMVPLCVGPSPESVAIEGSLALLHMRHDWPTHHDDDTTLLTQEKQLILKLFFNAITQNSDSRALAIARLMPDSSVVQIAIQAVLRLRKKTLAEQLGKLALSMDEEVAARQRRVEVVEDEEEEESDEDEEQDDDDDEEEEEEGGDDSEQSNGVARREVAQPKRVASVVDMGRLVNGRSPVREIRGEEENAVANGSPFRAVSRTPVVARRGMDAVDRLGEAKAATSEARQHNNGLLFGNFVPSPSTKTFKIKATKKRAAGADAAGPRDKRTKK